MSLKHVILTTLRHKSSTGYEITTAFDKSLGNFWRASHQQVYRELAALSEIGFVSFRKVNQTDRPNKKVYTITNSGKEELFRWLKKPSKPKTTNDELLVKLWAGDLLGVQELNKEIRNHKVFHESKLARYLAIEKEYFSYKTISLMPDSKRFQYMVLKKGILTEQMWINWSIEVERMLKIIEPH